MGEPYRRIIPHFLDFSPEREYSSVDLIRLFMPIYKGRYLTREGRIAFIDGMMTLRELTRLELEGVLPNQSFRIENPFDPEVLKAYNPEVLFKFKKGVPQEVKKELDKEFPRRVESE